jgi:hypothetical protein
MTMVRFELVKNDEKAISFGYPKVFPQPYANDPYYDPIIAYIMILDKYYIRFSSGNNIDNWLQFIDQQIYAKDNQEYGTDSVNIYFEGDKVKLIYYWDYEAGSRDFCELSVNELRKITVDWKWFVIDWEVKMAKGEL